MPMFARPILRAVSALAFLIACGEKPAEPAPAAAPDPATPPPPSAPAAPAAPAAPPSLELPAIPAGASVSFLEPADGATVRGPAENGKVSVPVKLGAENIAVKPAGQIEAGSGHHHILVDTTPDPEGAVVAKDDQHLHYGQGQTEATLTLAPGEHTLQLQFADGIHRSYGPKLAQTIKITVAEGPATGNAAPPKATGASPQGEHKH